MNQKIEKGKFLIATPILRDPNFWQTVVLLCEHGAEGSLGLVLNRPTEVEVSTAVNSLPNLAGVGRVFSGGPVQKSAMLILCHGNEPVEGSTILKNVFLAKDLDMMKIPGLLGPEGKLRCFLGYAGWGQGQLETEFKTGAWELFPADSDLIFNPEPAYMWQEMMRRLGGKWGIYATMPPDPNLN
jgi:putative transcriptional regulator